MWEGASNWSQVWPIRTHQPLFTWRVPMRKQTLFVYTRLGFEYWCKQIPKHLNEKTILLAQWSKLSSVHVLAHSGYAIRCCPMADSQLISELAKFLMVWPDGKVAIKYNKIIHHKILALYNGCTKRLRNGKNEHLHNKSSQTGAKLCEKSTMHFQRKERNEKSHYTEQAII